MLIGREPAPSATVIDSQRIKTFDAGEKVTGHKRHAMIETDSSRVATAHSIGIEIVRKFAD